MVKVTASCCRCDENVYKGIEDYAVIDGRTYCESCVVEILSYNTIFTCNVCDESEHSDFGNLSEKGVVCDDCYFEIHNKEAEDNVE